MKYVGMIDFKDNEFEVTTATNVEEAKKGSKSRFRLRHGKERRNAIQKIQEVQQMRESVTDRRRNRRINVYYQRCYLN